MRIRIPELLREVCDVERAATATDGLVPGEGLDRAGQGENRQDDCRKIRAVVVRAAGHAEPLARCAEYPPSSATEFSRGNCDRDSPAIFEDSPVRRDEPPPT